MTTARLRAARLLRSRRSSFGTYLTPVTFSQKSGSSTSTSVLAALATKEALLKSWFVGLPSAAALAAASVFTRRAFFSRMVSMSASAKALEAASAVPARSSSKTP